VLKYEKHSCSARLDGFGLDRLPKYKRHRDSFRPNPIVFKFSKWALMAPAFAEYHEQPAAGVGA